MQQTVDKPSLVKLLNRALEVTSCEAAEDASEGCDSSDIAVDMFYVGYLYKAFLDKKGVDTTLEEVITEVN